VEVFLDAEMTPGRQNRAGRPLNRSGTVKTEPGLNASATIAPSVASHAGFIASHQDEMSRAISVDQSFIQRGDRSNARESLKHAFDANLKTDSSL
jgi:hypothetical protein